VSVTIISTDTVEAVGYILYRVVVTKATCLQAVISLASVSKDKVSTEPHYSDKEIVRKINNDSDHISEEVSSLYGQVKSSAFLLSYVKCKHNRTSN
jgi:hypothetical protein